METQSGHVDRMQSYREYVRRKTENQRHYRAKLKEERATVKTSKPPRKYRRRIPAPESDMEILLGSLVQPAKTAIQEACLVIPQRSSESLDDDIDEFFVRVPGNNPPTIIVSPEYMESSGRVGVDDHFGTDLEEEPIIQDEEGGVLLETEEEAVDQIQPTNPTEGDPVQYRLTSTEGYEIGEKEDDEEQQLHYDIAEDIIDLVAQDEVEEEHSPQDHLEEFPIDEEQEAFFSKRDRILRLMDQLGKEDRLDYLTEIEGLLRTGVRKRIKQLQASNGHV